MAGEICLGAGQAERGRNHLAGGDLKVADQAQGATGTGAGGADGAVWRPQSC
jgi:hypothetical protein